MTDLSLFGEKNYLKRDATSGTTSITAPSTLTAWGNYITTYNVVHGLGYIPQVRVFFEDSATDGKVYPAGGRRLAGTYPGIGGTPIFCLWEADETSLSIILESFSSQSGSRNIYWVIYKDFEI